MTQIAANKPPVGFRKCTSPTCEAFVHYKKTECQTCGAVQDRTETAKPPSTSNEIKPPASNVVVHPSAKPAVVFEPYVVLRDFKILLGDVVGQFRANLVLTDHAQIEQLKAQNVPICPVSQAGGMACCPECRHVFALPEQSADKKRTG